jgi:hypothetical protein
MFSFVIIIYLVAHRLRKTTETHFPHYLSLSYLYLLKLFSSCLNTLTDRPVYTNILHRYRLQIMLYIFHTLFTFALCTCAHYSTMVLVIKSVSNYLYHILAFKLSPWFIFVVFFLNVLRNNFASPSSHFSSSASLRESPSSTGFSFSFPMARAL